jgi:nitric oxide reductase subunit B
MTIGIVGMSLAFGVAGVLQTYLERIRGEPFMTAQQPMRFWMLIVVLHGVMVVAGVFLTVKHLLTLRADVREAEAEAPGAASRAVAVGAGS